MKYHVDTVEMIQVTIPASEYGMAYMVQIVPVEGMYGVWLSREASKKVLYIYCLKIGPQEDVIQEVMANVPMYIDFYKSAFDEDDDADWF